MEGPWPERRGKGFRLPQQRRCPSLPSTGVRSSGAGAETWGPALWCSGSKSLRAACAHRGGGCRDMHGAPSFSPRDEHRAPTEAFPSRASPKFLADACIWPGLALSSCAGSHHLFPHLLFLTRPQDTGKGGGLLRENVELESKGCLLCNFMPSKQTTPRATQVNTQNCKILSRDSSSFPYRTGGVFRKNGVSTQIR